MTSLPDLEYERALIAAHGGPLVGIDEVGRGALAGPVTVGGVRVVALTTDAPAGVNDSKRVSARRRAALVPRIQHWADAWAIVHVPASVIDAVGIMAALSIGAGHVASSLLGDGPGVVLLDGSQDFVSGSALSSGATPAAATGWRVVTRVQADASCASVAAASILAKVARDAVMTQVHRTAPQYDWEHNKGYGSAGHRAAIAQCGSTGWHRRTWRLLPD